MVGSRSVHVGDANGKGILNEIDGDNIINGNGNDKTDNAFISMKEDFMEGIE